MTEGPPEPQADSQALPLDQPPIPTPEAEPAQPSVAGETVAPTLPLPVNPPTEQPADPSQSTQESPEAINTAPPTVIGDIHKAEVVAYAEKDFRDKAAENRTVGQPPREYREKEAEVQAVSDELEKAPQQFSGLQRLRLRRRRTNLNDELNSITDDALTADFEKRRETSSQFQDDFGPASHPPDLEDPLAEPPTAIERAEYYDQQASRIGDWAGILHDHPLSDEFLRTHSEFPNELEETAKKLAGLESNTAALERIIARHEKEGVGTMLETMDGVTGGGEQANKAGSGLQDLLGSASQEETEEYQRLKGELRGKAGEFDDFHNSLFDKYETQSLRDQLNLTRSVLNDVRREVGLPVEGDEAADAAQDQPAVGESETPERPQEASLPPDQTPVRTGGL